MITVEQLESQWPIDDLARELALAYCKAEFDQANNVFHQFSDDLLGQMRSAGIEEGIADSHLFIICERAADFVDAETSGLQ